MPADVSLRLLRYFVVLAEELNYRRAAEQLFISQPALSAAIRQLEQAIGGRLFDRDTRSVTLTAFGAAWLPTVRGNKSRPECRWVPISLGRPHGP